MAATEKKWIVGVSGASGMKYALRLIEVLSSLVQVHCVLSESAYRVLAEEEKIKVSPATISKKLFKKEIARTLTFYTPKDIGAAIASGSALFEGMIVCPCSMTTLGAIASGAGSNLLHRAADVTLKERRPLIIVPRETPLSVIHLQNLLTLAQAGARIVPAMPGFYHRPESLEDIIDMMVMKILDQAGIATDLVNRWKT